MKIARSARELAQPGRPACLAIGFFDGVHLGHQQIIRQAEADAQQHDATSLVVTFDRHPASVVSPERTPPLIQTMDHRLRTLEALGPDAAVLLRFDSHLREQPGAVFIRSLWEELGAIHSICIGADFHFGFQRSGNVELLRQLGRDLGFQVHGIQAVALEGHTVSSTRIRESIRTGQLETASQMLGRAYSISSRVIRGDRLGHQVGFPTANLQVRGLVLPPNGVYAAQTLVNGLRYHAVVNIGTRPTITPHTPDVRLEVHVLDFNKDLYDQIVDVVFVARLRHERRFDSREELRRQIQRDVAEARTRFGSRARD